MPIPSNWSDISQTAASNSPAGSEDPVTTDNYFRQVFSFIRKLYDGETAGQIAFPATQNASSDANTLDDYEEGDWTPAFVTSGGNSFTLTVQTGKYTKVGRQVTAQAILAWTAKSGSAALEVSGLPFTSGASSYAAAAIGYVAGVTGLTGELVVHMDPNVTKAQVRQLDLSAGATPTDLTPSNLAAGGQLQFTMTYHV
jgi:hypothetical protein